MALRLTKTSKVIFAISIVVLSGALGYLVWRVNQEDRLDPTEGEASCPSGCYWHSPTEQCVGPGGCIWEGSDVDPNTGACLGPDCTLVCDPCESEEEPAQCLFYPDGVTSTQPYNGETEFDSGYYKCDLAGYCIPCEPVSDGGVIKDYLACQALADAANGSLVTNCPVGAYKWVCDDLADGSGYILVEEPCVDEGDEEPALNCGTEPTYTFNKAPTTGIGPFTKGGEVILYYTSLLDSTYRPELTFSHNGATHVIKMPALDANKRARVETNIQVAAGDTITFVKSDDDRDQGDPECAPDESVNPKYISWGWIAPSGGECGSGLAGPPTGGISDDPMDKIAVLTSSYNSWVQGFGDEPVVSTKGSQCWADWREWPGDYDFNDYFLQIAYVPQAVIEETEPIWGITKNVVESCLDEGTENPVAQLTYTITVRNTGDGDGTIEKVTDDLDNKVLAAFVQSGITSPGDYTNGTILWDYTGTPLNIAAGTTKTYTYTLLIDKDSFGVYNNTVTLTPTGDSPVTATVSIDADCDVLVPEEPTPEDPEEPEEPVVTPEETIPETGIFDSTVGRVSVGLILVILGGIVYSMPNGVFRIQRNTYKYRERFERKVANK